MEVAAELAVEQEDEALQKARSQIAEQKKELKTQKHLLQDIKVRLKISAIVLPGSPPQTLHVINHDIAN